MKQIKKLSIKFVQAASRDIINNFRSVYHQVIVFPDVRGVNKNFVVCVSVLIHGVIGAILAAAMALSTVGVGIFITFDALSSLMQSLLKRILPQKLQAVKEFIMEIIETMELFAMVTTAIATVQFLSMVTILSLSLSFGAVWVYQFSKKNDENGLNRLFKLTTVVAAAMLAKATVQFLPMVTVLPMVTLIFAGIGAACNAITYVINCCKDDNESRTSVVDLFGFKSRDFNRPKIGATRKDTKDTNSSHVVSEEMGKEGKQWLLGVN